MREKDLEHLKSQEHAPGKWILSDFGGGTDGEREREREREIEKEKWSTDSKYKSNELKIDRIRIVNCPSTKFI